MTEMSQLLITQVQVQVLMLPHGIREKYQVRHLWLLGLKSSDREVQTRFFDPVVV